MLTVCFWVGTYEELQCSDLVINRQNKGVKIRYPLCFIDAILLMYELFSLFQASLAYINSKLGLVSLLLDII